MSDGSYFVDHKRGEVLELKQALTDKKVAKSVTAKREVIKKIIAYMTLGIDVSVLFSDMVMATNTRDLVIKKMIYLYLCTYAEKKPDVALLAVNTLLRDCRDDDPMIRGLALRSLCSLRVANLVEYVVTPIRHGLTDSSAYVRKAAVMGVAKLFAVAPTVVRDSSSSSDGTGDFVDILYNALKDKDINVCINAIHALNEILIDEGGIAVNKKLVQHLLRRMHEATEWGQITILDVVAKFEPSSKDEVFDIMNGLNDRLKHSNSALVLATVKVFLNLTRGKSLSVVHREVYKKVKTPLMTMISNPDSSLAYPVLCHVFLMVKKKPGLFADCYKHFYIRHNELGCIKEVKIKIMACIATEANYMDILNELSEYVSVEVAQISRLAIRSMAKACVRVGHASISHTLKLLRTFLEFSGGEFIIAETCVCVRSILRKFPRYAKDILVDLKKHMRLVEEEGGKCAVLWLLGEYGGSNSDSVFKGAPYIMEEFIDSFAEESSSAVKIEMLTASMKLFFKSPAEMQTMLGRLFEAAIGDGSRVVVRDRALLYYRLLKNESQERVQALIEVNSGSDRATLDVFEDDFNRKLVNKLFDEFNTLAVVYDKPSEMFVNEEVPEFEDDSEEDEDEEEEEDDEVEEAKEAATEEVKNDEAPPDLDLLGLGGGSPSLELKSVPVCTPALFKQCWSSLTVASRLSRTVKSSETAQNIEGLAKSHRFQTIASGVVGSMLKCYMFAQEGGGELHFVEFVCNLSTRELTVTVKGQSANAEALASLFDEAIRPALA